MRELAVTLVCLCVAADAVETVNCSSCCRATFSDVDESSRARITAADLDAGRCPSDVGDVDAERAVGAAASCDGVESTAEPVDVDDADPDVDAELNSASADDPVPPAARLAPASSVQPFAFFDGHNDDDARLDASDDYTLPSVSTCSRNDVEFDRVCGLDADAPVAGPRPFAGADGGVMDDGGPRSSSVTMMASQLIDNNVSPASKIAMLESVVCALHRQQMFQLELIEALRRQLATAIAASSRPGGDDGGTTLDLTLPRSSVVDDRSSLSSLVRLSAGVEALRAPPPPPAAARSPSSTSPTALSGSTSDGHDAAATAVTSWTTDPTSIKSRAVAAALPSSLLKHRPPPPLSDLSHFKKGVLVTPRLNDTTCCQTRLTTGLTTGCIV